MSSEEGGSSAQPFGTEFDVRELNQLLAPITDGECHVLAHALRARAAEVEKTNSHAPEPWRLLAELCDMHFKPSEATDPFGPLATLADGRRTLIPRDLRPEQRQWLASLVDKIADPELRARVADVLWIVARDAAAARTAVNDYLESAGRLEDPEHWTPTKDRLERAVRLAALLGRGGEDLFKHVVERLQDVEVRFGADIRGYLGARAMKLLLEFNAGDAEGGAQRSRVAADTARAAGDWYRSRVHLEVLEACQRKSGDAAGARKARITIAESFAEEAKAKESRSDFLAATHFWSKAIEAMRRAGGERARVDQLHACLLAAQARSVAEYGHVRTQVDISEVVTTSREKVSGLPLRDALIKLATIARPTDFAAARARAEELVEQFPLQGLFGGVATDRTGRVLSTRPSLLTNNPEAREEAMLHRVIEVANFEHGFTAVSILQPALRQIQFEHPITDDDVAGLVGHSAFVPAGRERLFTKGLLAWMEGDLVTAVHVLIPQVENSVRHLMANREMVVTQIDRDGVQRETTLDGLLEDRRLAEIFESDLVLEMQTLFTDRRGPHLRHRLAHGLLDDSAFQGGTAFYACWFVFVLCVLGTGLVRSRAAVQPDPPPEPEAPSTL